MATIESKTASRVAVETSKDRLSAWCCLRDPDDPRPLTREEVVAALEENKIALTADVHERIDAFIPLAGGDEEFPERFVIAQGRPAVEGKDGEFQWHESFQKEAEAWKGDAPVNYYALNSIVTVGEGEPVGTIVPPVPGADGYDVFGNKLTPNKRPSQVQLDSTVRRSDDDPAVVIANAAGKVGCESSVVSIGEVLAIKGDVDFENGNVDSPVDVHITGTIQDLFSVKSKKTISVCGAIEAAHVSAQGNVLVRGGILGRTKGEVTAAGDIIAKFCNEANLHAKGNIKVARQVMNSRIRCEGKLFAAHGALIGGTVYARVGVEVSTLGSEACVPTLVIVGVHPDALREAKGIEEACKAKRETVDHIRSTAQPLMANMKRLTPAQKERATELLYKADALDMEIEQADVHGKEILDLGGLPEPPYVLATKNIHQGTTIRIGWRHTVFNKDLKGPVRVEERKVENVTEFVAVNQLSGSVAVLPSAYVTEDEPAAP